MIILLSFKKRNQENNNKKKTYKIILKNIHNMIIKKIRKHRNQKNVKMNNYLN